MPLAEPVPDIRSLDLLRSVAELGSIRQAAAAHHISQPAASMRLRTLERALHLVLLDRSAGQARLTVAGLAVVQWSEAVLDAMRDLLHGTAAVRSESHDSLRIAASMTVAEYLVPTWMGRLRVARPDTTVSLEMGNSAHVAEVMHHGGADIGFVEGPDAPPGLRSRVVAGDDLVVVVAPTHPWARRRRPVGPADLASTPLIMRESGSGTREVLERALAAHGLAPTPLVELGSTTAIKASVTAGTAPGIVGRLAVTAELADGRLREVAVSGLALERAIRAVWSPARPLSGPAALLRQLAELS
jgi:DNA-binding transcriptional LysR family regulator